MFNKIKKLSVVSLIIVSSVSTFCSSAHGEKNNTPVFFRNLNKFKAVNVEDYGKPVREGPYIIKEYAFNIKNKYKVACSGPSNSDSTDRPIRCTGWVPNVNTSTSINTPQKIVYAPGSAEGDVFTKTDLSIPNDPTNNGKKLLPVGRKIIFIGNTGFDGEKMSKFPDTTCVVPNQDSFGCLASDKHGFYVDNAGTHTF